VCAHAWIRSLVLGCLTKSQISRRRHIRVGGVTLDEGGNRIEGLPAQRIDQCSGGSPRGSAIKFKYDPAEGVMTLARPLPAGLLYPFDWGFIPGPAQRMVIRWMSVFSGMGQAIQASSFPVGRSVFSRLSRPAQPRTVGNVMIAWPSVP
jgi:hypothetical protein